MKRSAGFFCLSFIAVLLMGQGCVSLSGSRSKEAGTLGVFVSVDQGEIWTHSSKFPTLEGARVLADVEVYRLVGDPQDIDTLYWLSRANGLFYSLNSGKSWQHDEKELSKGFIYSLAVHPQDTCTVVATNGLSVYRTSDCMRSWEEIYRESRPNVHVAAITYNRFVPHQIFLAVSNGDLLESADSGRSWRSVYRFRETLAQIEMDPIRPGVFYVASREEGLFRSNDNGQTWISLKDTMRDFSGSDEYRRFAVHPARPGHLYWVSTYGILESRNSGDTWEAMNLITPPGSAQIYAFAVNPNNEKEIYYTATINDRSTFYKSKDGGVTWITNKLPSGQLPTVLRVHEDDGNMLFLGYTALPKKK